VEKLNIGAAAAASGVSPKMIRHHEEIGLVPRVPRTASGYRVYGEPELHVLRFVKRLAMRRTLAKLADHCHGDHRPGCPILDDLAAD